MPFEISPATRSVDAGKRKRGDDDTESRNNLEVNGGKGGETVTDEEVDEFFAIVRRLHAATKCLEKIDGASRLLTGKGLKPSFEMEACEEEADQVKIEEDNVPEHKVEKRLSLDLNLVPASIESDVKGPGKERRSRSPNLKPSSPGSAASQK